MGGRYGQSITDRKTSRLPLQSIQQHRAHPCGSVMWKSFDKSDAPAIGVAPIIAGPARKGPTAKLMRQQLRARVAARHYGNLLDAYILDSVDAESFGQSRSACRGGQNIDADVGGS